MVLVGNKCDLEDDRVLSIEDGVKVSQDWGLVPFYETSAMYKTNVDEAFIDVVRQIMRKEAAISAEKKQQKNYKNNNSNSSKNKMLKDNNNNRNQENPNRLQHKRMQQQMAKQMSMPD